MFKYAITARKGLTKTGIQTLTVVGTSSKEIGKDADAIKFKNATDLFSVRC